MKVGVFDSGVGGENVVAAIKIAIPKAEVIFRDDRAHLPYGNKTASQILELMTPIMQTFTDQDQVDAIVIACNTASTNILDQLKELVSVPVIGFVPMIKPASLMTKTNTITVCATPGTLKSNRYAALKAAYARDLVVIEPDCSDWAEMIEANKLNMARIGDVVNQSMRAGSDVIVLGCTHYHWIEDQLKQLAGPNITIIQPTTSVIAELKRVLDC
ncbi:glutamate racemase [Candidatus Saccharibacteria bacterium]|nr:glutamate racemase [Candidatus Saccharibacteria bacterium]MCB9820925.1 glutamate racemase [Candidatus Nomurabacteria bacterium]